MRRLAAGAMRIAPGLVLAALALAAAPAALAQEAPPLVVVSVAPFEAPIPPEMGAMGVLVTVRGPCAILGALASDARVHVWVAERPAWTVASVAPDAFSVTPVACDGASFVAESALFVATTADAPALTEGVVVVAAAVEGAGGNHSGAAATHVQAGYFGSLAVDAPITIVAGEARQFTFPATIANLGNGDTRVAFEVADATRGWTASAPAPILLTSAQVSRDGGTAQSVQFVLEAPRDAKRDAQGSFTVRVASHYARDAAMLGESVTISFLGVAQGHALVPAPAGAAAALAFVAVALARRLPSSGEPKV